jgi:hypothetical protein
MFAFMDDDTDKKGDCIHQNRTNIIKSFTYPIPQFMHKSSIKTNEDNPN